jgi:hypothetical protein
LNAADQCCGLASAVEAQPTPWLVLSIAAGAADRSIVRPDHPTQG